MPEVYNKHKGTHDIPDNAVYVGRPSKWGNPYTVEEYGRGVAIQLYERLIKNSPLLIARARKELRGKDLVCWCAPHPCHADILLVIANEECTDEC